MSDLLARIEHELLDKPALVDSILQRPDIFPSPPAEPERVLLRCGERQIELGIHRGYALAILNGEVPRVEVIGDGYAGNEI